MSYPPTAHYLPPHPQQYYTSPHVPHGQPAHSVTTPLRQEAAQRKRPKYTRSKTGCLTCRVKKIKCDETKPNCMRCTHGQRDCTWPEGVPARKKSVTRKDSASSTPTMDGRPGTAGSSISDGSTPPTRDHTPPRLQPLDIDLPPLASRRSTTSDPYLQLHPVSDQPRRTADRFAYSHPSHSGSNMSLHALPEVPVYQQQQQHHHQSRYDYAQPSSSSARTIIGPGIRPLEHHQWTTPPPLLTPLSTNASSVDSYYQPHVGGGRSVMGPGSSNESQQQHRYQ
ncbi:hypothetical protein K435DRAFT_132060 [Dendrothele bispora CBS 962.96]|uniref:Zn(2)-C6 fungal-type domain-containing protein n=1 Tax=Dendrothele bispora (strain CBS 962.96) TaxID=1314807 RepID=A0A4S8M060_DENBC|nr:hypothetical protein K435DRAFT_132060 [Dendrothele bispora CBS 962.96]